MNDDYIKNLRSKIGQQRLMLPCVAAVILNSKNELLLVEKHDGTWSLPAGIVDPGETPKEALFREVLEETGLDVSIVKVLEIFGGKQFRSTCPNGDLVEYSGTLFLCDIIFDNHFISDANEIKSKRYFEKADLPDLTYGYKIEALFNELDECFIH